MKLEFESKALRKLQASIISCLIYKQILTYDGEQEELVQLLEDTLEQI